MSSNQERAIISTIGQDRPGLVTELTALVHKHGLSVEDSRMVMLGGDFAVIMAISGNGQALAELQPALASYCDAQGMESLFRRSSPRTAIQALPYNVSVTTMDHPGIVTSVANFFSDRGINILQLDTDAQPAPHTGTPMFNLNMTIAVPGSVAVTQLREQFGAFCDEQDLDGEIRAAN